MSSIINNITNIVSGTEEGNIVSLSKTLLIFYVVIASQFTGNLMGKQMKEFIQESRVAQHIIAFTMLLVLVNLVGGVKDVKKSIFYSLAGYIWFIFTTKLDIQWNFIIILLLVVGYLYESKMFEHEDSIKNTKDLLNTEEKNKIMDKNKNYRSLIVIAIIVVTLVGTFLYERKKGIQYGGDFSIKKYLFY